MTETSETDPWRTLNPHYVKSLVERTAVLERDLYHMTESVKEVSGRLSHLNCRMQTAEYHLEHAMDNIKILEELTQEINNRVPDLKQAQLLIRWLIDALKYVIGIAIFLGALSGKLSWEALVPLMEM